MAETQETTQSTGTADALSINFQDPVIDGMPMEEYLSQQVTNPGLPPGTVQTSIDVQENPNEIIDPNTVDVQSPQQPTTATGTAQQADQNAIFDGLFQSGTGQYDATQVTGAQGTVTQESTLKYQLEQYMAEVRDGNAPWADAAIRKANEIMLQRGLGASTMAGAAISQAILEAAAPLAQFDANMYGAMNLQNLRNTQEAMLSSQAADNAAKQFNAQSKVEVDKYMSALRDRVLEFNASQMNSMEQFNSSQENASNQFYDKMQNETDKFIAQNQLVIAQSNAEWRRNINLANTAAQNAALQQNVQNRFNLSQQAMANLWQRARDAFYWANVTSQNSKDRAFKIALYSMQRENYVEDMEQAQKNQVYGALGNLAYNILSGINYGEILDGLFNDAGGSGGNGAIDTDSGTI